MQERLQTPEKLVEKRRQELMPFVKPMKDDDHVELSEVDEDLIRENVKEQLAHGVPPEPTEDEAPPLEAV